MKKKEKTSFILILFSSFLIFSFIIKSNISTDIQSHSKMIVSLLEAGSFPVPPLYYALIFFISGFSTNLGALNLAAVLVLSASVTYKFILSYYFSLNNLQYDTKKSNNSIILILSLSLIFSAPIFYDIVTKGMYLGKLATNVWHNSTTILAMPFVILIFRDSLEFIKHSQPSKNLIVKVLIFGGTLILIKPSFLFALIPIFPLVVLLKTKKINKKVLIAFSISLILGIGIIYEYYLIYELDVYNSLSKDEEGGIVVSPFYFFNLYSKNIVVDAFVSLALPLSYCLLYPSDILKSYKLKYSIFLFLFSLFIGIVFTETGKRADHGNLTWQIVMSNYILFLVTLTLLYEKIQLYGASKWRNSFLLFVVFLHTASGFFYLFKILYFKSYF
ncbi:hypothetical protein SAMN05661096_01399 [Marivirga sericea]|uniref:EpsG family protein n=1 Tax=Marivirga sericea TaxID=1028 RepID=A0A1X7J7B8_9BACT|nr:hypothetical protein [Marivirga sericea]SMG23582.1 hypothetical protein SAMN05661096_01399 [Marivirga sericea]